MKQKIHIVDNGVYEKWTHCHIEAESALDWSKKLGLSPHLYCHKNALITDKLTPHQNDISKHFTYPLWRQDKWNNIHHFGQIFAKEFIEILNTTKLEDLFLLPNVSSDELYGLFLALENVKDIPKIFVITKLQVPEEQEKLYFHLIEKLGKQNKVKLLSDNSLIINIAKQFNVQIEQCGHLWDIPYEKIGTKEKKYDFSYLGSASDAKGFNIFLQSIQTLRQLNIEPNILVHANNANITTEIMGRLPNVTWKKERLSDSEYYDDLVASKYIVTFYDIKNYRLCTSNILLEAIALGSSCIASPMDHLSGWFNKETISDICTKTYSQSSLVAKLIEKYYNPNYTLALHQARDSAILNLSTPAFLNSIMSQ